MGARHSFAGNGVLRSSGNQPVKWFSASCIISCCCFVVLADSVPSPPRYILWSGLFGFDGMHVALRVLSGAHNSAIDHCIADPAVAGSIPAAFFGFTSFVFFLCLCITGSEKNPFQVPVA